MSPFREIFQPLVVGERIQFVEEKISYTVQAISRNYIVCTKPFHPRKTVIYSVINLETGMRGPDNMLFCKGYESRKDCEDRAADFEACRQMLSKRNSIPCNVARMGTPRMGKATKWWGYGPY